MMGISPEHLGAQVQCPHCQAIVQTPAPAQQAAAAAAPPPTFQVGEHESIFSQPEPDDLFGGSAAPQIQMPPLDVPPQPMPPQPMPPMPVSAAAPTLTMEPSPAAYEPAPPTTVPFPGSFTEPAHEELAAIAPPRRVPERSMFMPILLIFLVPYAIFTTAFIGYLIYNWPADNRLKLLPDTAPQGGPRFQVPHNLDLDKDMKTGLGQPIRVGAIEVTPVKVKHTAENDLVLVFRAKNVSSNQVFNPISDDYMKFSRASIAAGKPYTFLERVTKAKEKPRCIYGGYLEWYKGPPGQEQRFDGEIGPGEEAVIHLISEVDYRKREVGNFVKAKEPLVWRLQVRRGLVHVDGKDVSATTVIGVEFTSRDIVHEKDEG